MPVARLPHADSYEGLVYVRRQYFDNGFLMRPEDIFLPGKIYNACGLGIRRRYTAGYAISDVEVGRAGNQVFWNLVFKQPVCVRPYLRAGVLKLPQCYGVFFVEFLLRIYLHVFVRVVHIDNMPYLTYVLAVTRRAAHRVICPYNFFYQLNKIPDIILGFTA